MKDSSATAELAARRTVAARYQSGVVPTGTTVFLLVRLGQPGLCELQKPDGVCGCPKRTHRAVAIAHRLPHQ